MTDTKPNAELAYRVLDTALAHEDRFDMLAWAESADGSPVGIDDLTSPACNTVACLAGWTVAMAGYHVDHHAEVFDGKGERIGRKADSVAAELLRITEDEAEKLFYCGIDSVEDFVAEIFGPRPGGAA